MHQHTREMRTGHPVLDIGDETGGVIFLTPSELCWQEVEIAANDRPDVKTHTDVTERLLADGIIYTGVFPPLPTGEYHVCRPIARAGERFSITSGRVTQIDWRYSADNSPAKEVEGALQ